METPTLSAAAGSCLLLCLIAMAECDYKLEIHLNSYHNPSHKQADGRCCNINYGDYFPAGRCMNCLNRFTFCIRQFKTDFDPPDLQGVCSQSGQKYVTGIVGESDSISFKKQKYIDEMNNISNPLVFTSEGIWPGGFQFVVRIINWKSIFHEFVVDYIVEDWELAVNDNTKSQRKLYGVKEVADLTVSAVVECTGRLLCQNCTEICENEEEFFMDMNTEDPNTSNTTVLPKENGSSRPLAIGLSVVGSLFLLIALVIVILFAVLFWRKRTKLTGRSERQPFLRDNTGDGARNKRYEAANSLATDEDTQEDDMTFENPHYGLSLQGSKKYQRLPASENVYDEVSSGGKTRFQNRAAQVNVMTSAMGDRGGPGEGDAGYSIIRRQDCGSSESLIEDAQRSEGKSEYIESGYSVITKEDMNEHVSEASSGGEDEGIEVAEAGEDRDVNKGVGSRTVQESGEDDKVGKAMNRPRLQTPPIDNKPQLQTPPIDDRPCLPTPPP